MKFEQLRVVMNVLSGLVQSSSDSCEMNRITVAKEVVL